jgi:hypothetical protein
LLGGGKVILWGMLGLLCHDLSWTSLVEQSSFQSLCRTSLSEADLLPSLAPAQHIIPTVCPSEPWFAMPRLGEGDLGLRTRVTGFHLLAPPSLSLSSLDEGHTGAWVLVTRREQEELVE